MYQLFNAGWIRRSGTWRSMIKVRADSVEDARTRVRALLDNSSGRQHLAVWEKKGAQIEAP